MGLPGPADQAVAVRLAVQGSRLRAGVMMMPFFCFQSVAFTFSGLSRGLQAGSTCCGKHLRLRAVNTLPRVSGGKGQSRVLAQDPLLLQRPQAPISPSGTCPSGTPDPNPRASEKIDKLAYILSKVCPNESNVFLFLPPTSEGQIGAKSCASELCRAHVYLTGVY